MTNLQISNSFQTIVISIFANIFHKTPDNNQLSNINKDIKKLKKYFDNIDYNSLNEQEAKEFVLFIENSIKILNYLKKLETSTELTPLFNNINNSLKLLSENKVFLQELFFEKQIENKWKKFVKENPDEKLTEIEKSFFYGLAEVEQIQNQNRKYITFDELLNEE